MNDNWLALAAAILSKKVIDSAEALRLVGVRAPKKITAKTPAKVVSAAK